MWSFDPGLATGWCHVSVHDDGEVGCFNYGEADHTGIGNLLLDNPALKAAVSKREIETIFVAERFTMGSKITQSPWSLETIGLIRYFAGHYGIQFDLVERSAHKTLIKDPVIKAAGLWAPTEEGHANDAVRIALWYLITKKGVLQECLRISKNSSES